jgi:hypothetical protein
VSLRPLGRPGPRLTCCSGAGAIGGWIWLWLPRVGVGGGFEGLGAGGEGEVREAEVGPAIVVYGKEPKLCESCQWISCIASSGKELRTGMVGVVRR